MKTHLQPLMTKSANSFRNKNNYIYIILVVAFLLRLGAFISFSPWDESVVSSKLLLSDGASYQNLALGMLEGYDNGETFWAPGFPAFLAAVYSIVGVKPWVILFLNCFISTFSVFLLYLIGKKLFTEKIALFSAILLAIEPHQIVYTQTFFSENLFIPLILLFFLFFINYLAEHKRLLLVVAAVFLGLSMYFRPAANFLFIPVIISLYIF
ncbi:MAG: glycosyltransferase family 39 protein [Ignavibacteriales bacterium]|nr:glycosyltransferase family 39 protein [Ignavibacteriales bacterium]